MVIRDAVENDLEGLLLLYTQLHKKSMPAIDPSLHRLWSSICADENHHVLVAEEDRSIVSSCVVVIVPNLTHGQRPYALVENVVTDEAHRRRGLASACLSRAREIAEHDRCYKIMLMTGSKDPAVLAFYRSAGYNDVDKTAFIQWL